MKRASETKMKNFKEKVLKVVSQIKEGKQDLSWEKAGLLLKEGAIGL